MEVAVAQIASGKGRQRRRKTRGAALAARATLTAAAPPAVLEIAPRGGPVDALARGRRLCSAGAMHLRPTLRSHAGPTPLLCIVRSRRPAPRSHAGGASREARPRRHEMTAAAAAAPAWLRRARRPAVSDRSLVAMLWVATRSRVLRFMWALRTPVGPRGRRASQLWLRVRSVARHLS